MKLLTLVCFLVFSALLAQGQGQGFEWIDRQENIQAGLGQTVRIPIRIKNTSDKAQILTVRKAHSDLGTNQKGYFCLGDECSDPSTDLYSRRLEPGETLTNFYFVVETGLTETSNSLRFEVYPRMSPTLGMEQTITLSVDEKPAKSLVFQSKEITVHDVYPNPVTDQAFIDYRIYNETVKAKIVIHNILGSAVGNYDMPYSESRIKVQADEFTSGVYFYTVYLNNVGVLTRKMVVRK